jgi:hypothetical protein
MCSTLVSLDMQQALVTSLDVYVGVMQDERERRHWEIPARLWVDSLPSCQRERRMANYHSLRFIILVRGLVLSIIFFFINNYENILLS